MGIIFLVFLIGLCVGSFLNVAIFRVHEGEQVVRGRSKCMKCEEPLGPRDLVPVLSYVALKGRCRRCKAVVSWQYPVIELVTGLVFVLLYLLHGMEMVLLRDAVFVAYLIIIFVYDLRYMYILDKFTIPAMIFALLANLWLGIVPAWSILVGGLVLASFFAIQYLVSRGTWVGGGDIRMGALMGFMLGLTHGLVALFLAYVLGGLVGAYLLITGKVDRKTPIPFGTFLAIGTLLMILSGDSIISWYLGFFV
jgi:prepilin signal peptidase PulO-like enzyme (type II secretory pathway)